MCSGWVIGSCMTKAQGWGGKAFVLCDSGRICLFSQFLQPPFDKSSQIYIITMVWLIVLFPCMHVNLWLSSQDNVFQLCTIYHVANDCNDVLAFLL